MGLMANEGGGGGRRRVTAVEGGKLDGPRRAARGRRAVTTEQGPSPTVVEGLVGRAEEGGGSSNAVGGAEAAHISPKRAADILAWAAEGEAAMSAGGDAAGVPAGPQAEAEAPAGGSFGPRGYSSGDPVRFNLEAELGRVRGDLGLVGGATGGPPPPPPHLGSSMSLPTHGGLPKPGQLEVCMSLEGNAPHCPMSSTPTELLMVQAKGSRGGASSGMWSSMGGGGTRGGGQQQWAVGGSIVDALHSELPRRASELGAGSQNTREDSPSRDSRDTAGMCCT